MAGDDMRSGGRTPVGRLASGPMNARERFASALAEAVSTAYYAEGLLYLSLEQINAIADEHQVPEAEARAVLDLMDERMLLQRQEGGWAYSDGIGLLLQHEAANPP